MKLLKLNAIETQYIRHYLSSQKRIMIMCFIILFVIMGNFMQIGSLFSFIFGGFMLGYRYDDGIFLSSLAISVCALSFLIPFYQYRFIMMKRSNDLYLSLPITRKRIFSIHFLLGGGFLVISTIAVFCVTLIVSSNFSFLEQLMKGMLLILIGLALYSMFCWIVVKCNTVMDYILVSAIYILFPLIIFLSLNWFANSVTDSIMVADEYLLNNSIFLDSNLMWSAINFISAPWLMRSIISVSEHREFLISVSAFASWMVLFVVFYLQGRTAFSLRKAEDCGQRTTAWMSYPIFIPLITLLLLLIALSSESYWGFLPFVIIAYVMMQFFAMRNIRMNLKIILPFAFIFVVGSGITWIAYDSNFFGKATEKPEISEVQSVQLSFYISEIEELGAGRQNVVQKNYRSKNIADPELLAEIMRIQDQAIEAHEDILDSNFEYRIVFSYESMDSTNHNVKDDTNFTYRSYSFIKGEGYRKVEPWMKSMIERGILVEEQDNPQDTELEP